MPNRNGKRDHFAGGIGLLTAAVYLCLQGLKEVVFSGNINTFHARSLAHKLLHALFAMVDFRVLGLRQILPYRPFEQIGGQSAAGFAHLDCQGNGFIPHFVLHSDLPPSCKRRRAGSASLAALGMF